MTSESTDLSAFKYSKYDFFLVIGMGMMKWVGIGMYVDVLRTRVVQPIFCKKKCGLDHPGSPASTRVA